MTITFGTHFYEILNLDPGVNYEIQVRAVDIWGNASGWTTPEIVTASEDTIPPSQPAAPVVAGNPLHLLVEHSLGKSSGGTFNLEADVDHLEVHVGDISGFLPSATTLKGVIPVTPGNLSLSIKVISTFEVPEAQDGDGNPLSRYVRVIAVDRAGNSSDPSEEVTATIELISSQYVSDLTVDRLTGGTISTTDITVASRIDVGVGGVIDVGAGGVIQSNYGPGVSGYQLRSDGTVEFNTITARGRLETLASPKVMVGKDVGPGAGHDGLMLSELNFDNGFFRRRSDGALFFHVNKNAAGNPQIVFDGATGTIIVMGRIVTALSGLRIEFDRAIPDQIRFFSGVVSENFYSFLRTGAIEFGYPGLEIRGPGDSRATQGRPFIILSSAGYMFLDANNPRGGVRQQIQGVTAFRSTPQGIPHNTFTDLLWNAELFDHGDFHNLVSNTHRLTIPGLGLATGFDEGYYVFGVWIQWQGNINGKRTVQIVTDNGTVIGAHEIPAGSNARQVSFTTAPRHMVFGGTSGKLWAKVQVYQDSGGTLNVEANSRFWCYRVGVP